MSTRLNHWFWTVERHHGNGSGCAGAFETGAEHRLQGKRDCVWHRPDVARAYQEGWEAMDRALSQGIVFECHHCGAVHYPEERS